MTDVSSEHHSKEIAFNEASARLEELKKTGKRIVQCHGTFDLIHPGHIVHLEEAKELGDILVVTITDETHVNKGPGRPYFNNALRVKSLTSIESVDHVVVVPFPTAVEAIKCVRPDVYCKGREYADQGNDVTGNIADDVKTVEACGGEIQYIGSVVFSSTKLLNNHFEPYPADVKEFCQQVAKETSPDEFKHRIEELAKLKVLILGDIIFDKYTTIQVQGLSSKNRMLSGRYISEEIQAGGALAVYRHIASFTPHVKLLSLIGNEPWVDRTLRLYLPEKDDLTLHEDMKTIVKQRFIEPTSDEKELSKLFSVNYIDPDWPDREVGSRLARKIEKVISDFDLVIVMDFGHGVMLDEAQDVVQNKAVFLSLNCQTNSNNYGFNIINQRYQRADSFSLDRTEISFASGKKKPNYSESLASLKEELNARYAWLTLGDQETIGMHDDYAPCYCTPYEPAVIDTIGAGDAFCALASLSAVAGHSLQLATFSSQLAGAQAVKIIGNRDSLSKARFLKAGMTMLSF